VSYNVRASNDVFTSHFVNEKGIGAIMDVIEASEKIQNNDLVAASL
jgi:hypothetical protein